MFLLPLVACVERAPAGEASVGFWEHWGDGKAEIATYALTQPRYGALHPGTAVLITVTEDFSWSERVKADPGQHPETDIRKVLKLNATRTFDTGIYTYNVMTSVFSRIDGGDGMKPMDPIKITFSAQEWCGMVYDELVMGPGKLHTTAHTYFDSDTRPPSTAKMPSDVVYADALPMLLRGLTGEWIGPGEVRTVPLYPSQMEQRFRHEQGQVTEATIKRASVAESKTVPAGTFDVERFDVSDGRTERTWYLEKSSPHRIIGWEASDGERAELRGVDRLPYWELHNPEHHELRARVGL